MPSAFLPDRGVVLVSGPDARDFLQNLVTADIDGLESGEARLGALLTPQGKIQFDFLITPVAGEAAGSGRAGYLLDCAKGQLPDLVRRLGLYKLRAKVEFGEATAAGEPLGVLAVWGDEPSPPDAVALARDARVERLGERAYVRAGDASGMATADAAAYHTHRIVLGVPEGGRDYVFGDTFPHDADLDQLGGVGFRKGCFVGQEVVSRMEHRGTARRRIVIVRGDGLAAGAEVSAAGRALGTIGSVAGTAGLAMLRLDRVREALDARTPITAGATEITVELPGWARFGWPQAAE